MDVMDDKLEQLLDGRRYKKLQEQAYAQVVEQYQLSLLDVKVLFFLETHNANDTAKDIVNSHYFTKSNVSKSIETLLERGYLQKKYDSHDRRYIHLKIQPLARPLLEDVRRCQRVLLQTIFQGVTEEEIQIIRRVAQKINQNTAEALRANKP